MDKVPAIVNELAQNVVALEKRIEQLSRALRFYARGSHVIDDYQALERTECVWEVVMGACKTDEEAAEALCGIHIEDGTFAQAALAMTPENFEKFLASGDEGEDSKALDETEVPILGERSTKDVKREDRHHE